MVSTLRAVPTHLSFGQRACRTQLLPTDMLRRLSEKAHEIPGCGMKLEQLCLTLGVPKEHLQTFSGELTPETSLSRDPLTGRDLANLGLLFSSPSSVLGSYCLSLQTRLTL